MPSINSDNHLGAGQPELAIRLRGVIKRYGSITAVDDLAGAAGGRSPTQ